MSEIEELKKRYYVLDEEISSLDVSQSSYKVAANSFYGVTGLPYFKYYDPDIAEAITATGQVSILKAKEILDDIFSKLVKEDSEYVAYCDTDSGYVNIQKFVDKFCQGKSDQEVVDFVEKLIFNVVQPELNKRLKSLVSQLGSDNCRLDMKLECIGPSAIFLAKKKYMFDILYAEGVRYKEPKMKVMGIEIVRSSTPSVVKDYLKKAAKICLSGTEEEMQNYVKEVKKDFMIQDYAAICFPRGVNGLKTYASNSSIYMKGCPIHVRASLLYNHHLKRLGLDTKYPLIHDGEKIKFVYLKKPNHFHEDVIAFPNKLPVEFNLEQYIDKETQFEKTFLKPLEGISSAIKWHTSEQPSLDSLFE
jgi:DNA polymerase elongation subunit (family B)